jgi:uncharacterized protein (DUF1330 family)
MAKGYWFLNLDVVNPVDFITYRDANLDYAQRHHIPFLVRGGDFEQMEGIKRHRNVLVEFPSFEAAVAAHSSAEYAPIARLRGATAICDLAAVEGFDGPQPSAAPPTPVAGRPLGYWMVRIDVSDPERYKDYAAAVVEPFAEFGAWFVVRGGRNTVLEGKGRQRYVVLAFTDVETARACYFSLGYQRALAIRKEAAEADFVIISGFSGRETFSA